MNISVALGGGGARGYAHIGVLRRLETEGFHIRAVTGASAGGIVAVAYAAGFSPDEMETIFVKLDQTKLFARSSNEGPSLLGLSGAARFFEELFGDRTFSDLRIPCAVVAVDLKECQEVILNKGRVVDAILATIAVPGVFPPRQYGDSQLVDGAVLDPFHGAGAARGGSHPGFRSGCNPGFNQSPLTDAGTCPDYGTDNAYARCPGFQHFLAIRGCFQPGPG